MNIFITLQSYPIKTDYSVLLLRQNNQFHSQNLCFVFHFGQVDTRGPIISCKVKLVMATRQFALHELCHLCTR